MSSLAVDWSELSLQVMMTFARFLWQCLSADGGNASDVGCRIRRLIGAEETTRVGITWRSLAAGTSLLLLLSVSQMAWGKTQDADEKKLNKAATNATTGVANPNDFGNPVAGIKIRLHPLTPIKLNSSPMVLSFDTKQEGELDLVLSQVDSVENRLEIDGELYLHPGLPVTEEHQHHFRSVKDTIAWQNVPGLRIVLDGQWKSETSGEALTLASGTHFIRFGWGGFHPLAGMPELPDKNRPTVVWSNVAELNVRDYAEVAIAYNSGLACYDLDTEKGIGPPAHLTGPEQLAAFDLLAGHSASGSILTGQFRKLIKVDSTRWNERAPAIAEQLVQNKDVDRDTPQQLAQQGEQGPVTWIVETKEGLGAILQIEFRQNIKTELNGTVDGYLVRYRRPSTEGLLKTELTDSEDDSQETNAPKTLPTDSTSSKSTQSMRVEGVVLNADKQPIAGAPIAFLALDTDEDNAFRPIYLDADAEGRFNADIPSQKFRAHVGSPNDKYESCHEFHVQDGNVVTQSNDIVTKLMEGKLTIVATLLRTYKMQFEVLDTNGQDIDNVAILYKDDEATWYESEESDYATGAAWIPFRIVENGKATFQSSTPGIMGQAHVLVAANGYKPIALKLDVNLQRGQPIIKHVRMEAIAPVEFILTTSTGTTAAGATLKTLKSKELRAIRNYNGGAQLDPLLKINVQSDAQGIVRFPRPAFSNWTTYRVEHPTGYVNVRGKDLPKAAGGQSDVARKIRLVPYAGIRGSYRPQIKANEFLELYRLQSNRQSVDGPSQLVNVDIEGRFQVSNLLSGWYSFVHRSRSTENGTMATAIYGPYELQAGVSRAIALGDDGRSVVGRFVLPVSSELGNRPLTVSVSSGKWPGYPVPPPELDGGARLEWWNDYWMSDKGQQFRDYNRRSYRTAISGDGTFYFPSLPPGEYKLSLDVLQSVGTQSQLVQTDFEIPDDKKVKSIELGDLSFDAQSQKPMSTGARKLVATIFGTTVYLDQLVTESAKAELSKLPQDQAAAKWLENQGEALLSLISRRAIEDYVRREQIEITPEMSAKLLEAVNAAELQSDPNSKMSDEQQRGGLHFMMRGSLMDWLVCKSLYERYGGRVGMGSLGLWIAVDGRNELMREYIENGSIVISDAELERAFWKAANKPNFADAYPQGEELKRLMASPPLFRNRPKE